MTTTVYIAYDVDDEPLYVGHTSLPVARRLALHRNESEWPDSVARVSTTEFDHAKDAQALERQLILDFEPLHNVQGNPRYSMHFDSIWRLAEKMSGGAA